MSSSANPRFRVRNPDGTEFAVDSVEELQRRIRDADIDPKGDLFDVGTGEWAKLSEVPVFLFILEELRFEEELPDMYEVFFASETGAGAGPREEGPEIGTETPIEEASPRSATEIEAAPDEEVGGEEPGGEEADGEDRTDAAEQALGLDFDIVDFEFESPSPPERGDPRSATFEAKARRRDRQDEPGGEVGGPDEEERPEVMLASEGGLTLPETDPKALAEARERQEGEPDEDSPAIWRPDPGEPARADSTLRRRLPLRPLAIAGGGVLLLALVLVTGIAFLGGDPEVGEPIVLPVPSEIAPAPEPPAPPETLEESVTVVLAAISEHFAFVGDSLRAAGGLPEDPPRAWLTGLYFANASEYRHVRDFWEDYSVFLVALAPTDEAIYREGVRLGIEELEARGATSLDQLEDYFEERYLALSSHRAQRFAYLAEAARAAVALHDLLELHEDEIAYSPALGRGVSADPILEAAIPEGPVRREVDRALDRVIEALTRARGGGRPSPDGLRTDLFLVLGEG